MQYSLTLVDLTPEQILKAKEANGNRKRITYALICGPYGQMFGTEKQCLKYFTVWDPEYRIEVAPGKFKAVFPDLFDKAVRSTQFEITDYKSTWDLVLQRRVMRKHAQVFFSYGPFIMGDSHSFVASFKIRPRVTL